jgi:hypothetical protein
MKMISLMIKMHHVYWQCTRMDLLSICLTFFITILYFHIKLIMNIYKFCIVKALLCSEVTILYKNAKSKRKYHLKICTNCFSRITNYKDIHISYKHSSHTLTNVVSAMILWCIHSQTPARSLTKTKTLPLVSCAMKFSHSGNVRITHPLLMNTS